jgi:adenine-specific DNA-methyltransferase
MSGADTDASHHHREESRIVTSNQENQAPNADELSAEIVALRERVAELEAGATLGLNWREIPEDVERLLVEEVPVLTHVKNLDVSGQEPGDVSHILIEGDNLHALHTLQATHKGRVDAIYIDPPYNTGNEFIYNDKLIDKENRWRHSAWLSSMHKRLVLASELLAETGLIAISIDDNEQARLKLLCDAVFGAANFVVCAPTIMNLKGNQDEFGFAGTHEYTLVYAKSLPQATIGEFAVDDEVVMDEWEEDEHGWWKQGAGLKATGTNGPRTKRPNLWYPLYVAKDGFYVTPKRKKKSDDEVWPITNGQEMSWRWSAATAEEKGYDLIANGSSPNWTIYKKQRPALGDLPTKKPKSTLYSPAYSSTNGTNVLKRVMGDRVFPNPKPVDLIKDLLAIMTKKDGAVVLDFFAGSGTTLHALAQLNADDGGTRRCILVTNNEGGICRDVTQPRCKAVLTGKWADGKHEPLPGSLRFYTMSFMKRRRNPDRMRMDVAAHTVDLVAVREMVVDEVKVSDDLAMLFGDGRSIAVVPTFDADHKAVCALADKQVRDGDERRAYLFTWNSHGIEPEVAALWPGWEVQPLPAEMLAELRNLAPARNLFDEAEALS